MKTAILSRKGQLFSGDIAIATMIFMAALALAFFLWNSTTEEINKAEKLRDLQKMAASTVEQLIRTPGVPEYWIPDPTCNNIDNLAVPGLATEDRRINSTKAGYFLEIMNTSNYETCKHIMGLGEYDFYMEILNLTNLTQSDPPPIQVNGIPFVAGKAYISYDEAISIIRTAIYDNTLVRVNFVIWK